MESICKAMKGIFKKSRISEAGKRAHFASQLARVEGNKAITLLTIKKKGKGRSQVRQEELPYGKGKDKGWCCLQSQEHPQLLQQWLRSVGLCLSSSFKKCYCCPSQRYLCIKSWSWLHIIFNSNLKAKCNFSCYILSILDSHKYSGTYDSFWHDTQFKKNPDSTNVTIRNWILN